MESDLSQYISLFIYKLTKKKKKKNKPFLHNHQMRDLRPMGGVKVQRKLAANQYSPAIEINS